MRPIQQISCAAIVAMALASPALAQNTSQVSQSDIQRLQDSTFQAAADVQQLKGRDATRAAQLQTELDDLRDEVIYLKVKLRKEGSLQRTEYASVRDRLDDLRSKATNYTTSYTPSAPAAAPSASNTAATGTATSRAAAAPATSATQSSTSTARNGTTTTTTTTTTNAGPQVEIPSGTEMDVRLTNTLNSGTAQVEDRFEGTTLVDVVVNGRTVIPAGSVMRGVVTSVDPATRTNRTAKMTVSFDQVTVNGRAYPIRGTVTQAIQGEGIKGETGRIATGAGVGAVLGGILGGVKGAILGTVIGGGGITAATEGKELELPQGSVLRVRLDSPVSIPTAR
jgi:FtsP/CotA-like multicopper oxidase with cupredoxin domain